MKHGRSDRQVDESQGPLYRGDQRIVAWVAAIGVCGIALWWGYHGGWRGNLVELDRAAPYEVTFTLDINEAQWPEFAQLPGVGETLARRIVNERQRGGRFASVDELDVRVFGIGPKIFERIKQHLRPVPADDDQPDSPRSETPAE